MSLFSNQPRRGEATSSTSATNTTPERSPLQDLRVEHVAAQDTTSLRRAILAGAVGNATSKGERELPSPHQSLGPLSSTPSLISSTPPVAPPTQGVLSAITSKVNSSPRTELGQNMRTLTKEGVRIVTHFESFSRDAYKCPGGTWTIGYGHTRGVKEGDTLPNQAAGVGLLKQDLRNAASVVRRVFGDTRLTQGQFEALTSLAFNCTSAVVPSDSRFARHALAALPKINVEQNPEKKLAMEKRLISHMCKFSNADGQFLDGLLRRRLSEGLRLVGAKDPLVTMQEYKALQENARVHLGKPHAKTEDLAPIMVSYLLKHRLSEGKPHPAHRHEQHTKRNDYSPTR